MNAVLTFLCENQRRLGLERYGVPARPACVILTPRFRASSHVVFLMLAEDGASPVLVAKVPRVDGVSAGLEREAHNLKAVHATHQGGFDSIPRVVAFEQHRGRPILIETALAGQPMDRATVRRDPAGCCDAVLNWLTDVQQPACSSADPDPDWFERLIGQPLRYFADVFPASAEEAQLLERTWELVAPLHNAKLPLVIEHGDLMHPNILLLKDGGVGVVDWELAEPQGLPACDLFFFLTYVAFARHKARSSADYLSAFHAAFFKPAAWARPYIEDYTRRLQLPPHALRPLFILCWARYTANLLIRISQTDHPSGRPDLDTAAWLRANRYYALWQHTLTHINELNWRGLATAFTEGVPPVVDIDQSPCP